MWEEERYGTPGYEHGARHLSRQARLADRLPPLLKVSFDLHSWATNNHDLGAWAGFSRRDSEDACYYSLCLCRASLPPKVSVSAPDDTGLVMVGVLFV